MKSLRDRCSFFFCSSNVLFCGLLCLASAGCEIQTPQPALLEWQWSNDQTVCQDPNGFDSYENRYPTVLVNRIVARDDESVFGAGNYTLPSQGLPSQYGEYISAGGITREGPHTFKLEVNSGGASASWSTVDYYHMSISALKACGAGPYTGTVLRGPLIEPVGGDIGFYRQNLSIYQCADTVKYTCLFGELSKHAAPQWSQGTTEVCAHSDFAFTGDAAGNVVTVEDTQLRKYDPSGAIVLDVPTPYDFTPTALGLSPMGDVHAALRSKTEVRLARADSSGTLIWSKTFSSSVPTFTISPRIDLAVDASGKSIIAFHAYDTIDLGNGPMPAIGESDIVLAQFDVQGNVSWAKRMGGGKTLISSMRKTGADEIALVAHFEGSIDLGYGVINASPSLVKYDTNGNAIWSAELLPLYPGSSADVLSVAIAGHPSGAVFVAGSGYGAAPANADPTCDLGPSPLLPGTNPISLRMFTVRYNP